MGSPLLLTFYPLPIDRVTLSHGGVRKRPVAWLTGKEPPKSRPTLPPTFPACAPPSRRGQGVCAPGFVYRNHLHPLALGPAPAVGDKDGHKWACSGRQLKAHFSRQLCPSMPARP